MDRCVFFSRLVFYFREGDRVLDGGSVQPWFIRADDANA